MFELIVYEEGLLPFFRCNFDRCALISGRDWKRRVPGPERPLESQIRRESARPLLAGCVRSRTAASEQRSSWNPCVPDRQLCGSCYDRLGSRQLSRPRNLSGSNQSVPDSRSEKSSGRSWPVPDDPPCRRWRGPGATYRPRKHLHVRSPFSLSRKRRLDVGGHRLPNPNLKRPDI